MPITSSSSGKVFDCGQEQVSILFEKIYILASCALNSLIKVVCYFVKDYSPTLAILWLVVCYEHVSFFVVVSLCRFNQVNAISLACSSGLEDCKTLVTGWFRELMENPTNNTWVQSIQRVTSLYLNSLLSILELPHFSEMDTCLIPSVLCSPWALLDLNNPSSCVIICSRINPNLKSVVYCNAIKEGGEKEWDFAWSLYQNATVATEAEKLMHALACTTEPWLLNRLETMSWLNFDLLPCHYASLISCRFSLCAPLPLTTPTCVSGTWRIAWTPERSGGCTPPLLSSPLPVTALASLWRGTLSKQTGAVCIMSKFISNASTILS